VKEKDITLEEYFEPYRGRLYDNIGVDLGW
jgi:hypothetical protein